MKRILITGGSGTVSTAFIKEFYHRYHFISYSRNEKKQVALKRNFENVELYMGSVEDLHGLINTFLKTKPDIVIHAAAIKHIETGEKQPAQAVKVNLLGSLNVIEASRIANVPITIGISTDKACGSNSVYGYTKTLMERLFLEADDDKNRFVCCRLGNVAGSHGSVIPYWYKLAKANKPLLLTDPNMNRFMFSPKEAAYLVHKAIDMMKNHNSGYILTKKIKSVNMLALAKHFSSHLEIVGKRRGENLNEMLISSDEIPYTHVYGDYVTITMQKSSPEKNRMPSELTSLNADKMTKKEIGNLIRNVKDYLDISLLTANEY